jgi:hypothetical protein
MGQGLREQQVFVVKKRLPKGSHKGRQSLHNQTRGKYAKQHLRTSKNKIVARQKHLANHPNDFQAIENIRKALAKFD